jgi:hypothetical protein
VNRKPAMVTSAVRAPPVFGEASKTTDAAPRPAGFTTRSQLAVVVADQSQPSSVCSATETLPPLNGTDAPLRLSS